MPHSRCRGHRPQPHARTACRRHPSQTALHTQHVTSSHPHTNATGSCGRSSLEAAAPRHVPYAAPSRHRRMMQVPGGGHSSTPPPCAAYSCRRLMLQVCGGGRSPTPRPLFRILMTQALATDSLRRTPPRATPLCRVLAPQAHAADLRQGPQLRATPLLLRPHATDSFRRFPAEAAALRHAPDAASSCHRLIPQICGGGCSSAPRPLRRVITPQAHAADYQWRPQPCTMPLMPRTRHILMPQISSGGRSPAPRHLRRVLTPQAHAADFRRRP